MGHKLQPTFVQGKKRPEQPLQAAKLASESGIVVRDHMPIYTHWKHYKNAARNHAKDHRFYLAVSPNHFLQFSFQRNYMLWFKIQNVHAI